MMHGPINIRKAKGFTYFECGFEDLGTQHAMRMRYIVFCGLPGSTAFLPHYLINEIGKKKCQWKKICVLIFSTIFC